MNSRGNDSLVAQPHPVRLQFMIRMRFPLLVATFQLLACVHSALAATQTRAQEDSANASRRCSLGRKAQELSAAVRSPMCRAFYRGAGIHAAFADG